MDIALMEKAFALVAEEESRGRYLPTVEKTEAVSAALAMLPAGGRLLDLGSVAYTLALAKAAGFDAVGWNLSDGDMHGALFPQGHFDAILARHVIEHSAFPLYLLLSLHRSLKDGGHMAAVVPFPETDWVLKHPAHVSVLPKEQWERLFMLSGFSVVRFMEGTWTKEKHREMRFLLKKV
jgi:SAM-dependent methyltransferase